MAMTQAQYDTYREDVYAQAKAIVDEHDRYRDAGQLTQQALDYYINGLDQLMRNFQATTDSTRKTGNAFISPGIAASWLDPRFHDIYDFFMGIENGWRSESPSPPQTAPPPVNLPAPPPVLVPDVPAPYLPPASSGGPSTAQGSQSFVIPTPGILSVPGGQTNAYAGNAYTAGGEPFPSYGSSDSGGVQDSGQEQEQSGVVMLALAALALMLFRRKS